jgi:hypothetical protein
MERMFQQARKVLGAAVALGALALGGSAIANAATSQTGPTGSTGSGSSSSAPQAFNGPAHGTAAHEDAEKAVTGGEVAKVQAAAEKAAGGGKAGAVTTDYTHSGYETTVTKSDGSQVEIHLDSALQAFQGGPGGHGGPGDAPGA